MSRQYWTLGPGRGALRRVDPPTPGPGEALIRTQFSGISTGTETLVHRGEVPAEVADLMAAPHQLGTLPHPVSHGYLNVGVVDDVGPAPAAQSCEESVPSTGNRATAAPDRALVGRTVFTLAGHRDHVVVPVEDCHILPTGCPADRALLAGAAETGLNALWESQATIDDRLAVVGGGMIGLATALLASRLALQRLQVVELDAERRRFITALGLDAVAPGEATGDNDVVLHSSASPDGLAEALRITGDDGTVVEQSWYGTGRQSIPLGADFHARRLRLVAAQVGEVAQPRRLRRSRRDRLSRALELLDDRFDALLTGRSPLEDLPAIMDALAAGGAAGAARRSTICQVIDHRRRAGADEAPPPIAPR